MTQFDKRGQLFIRSHNETLSVVSMRVNNPDCSPVGFNCSDAAPTPTSFAEIVSDYFPVSFHGCRILALLGRQLQQNVYVVVAPASRGLHIRSEPNAKSAIVATLHQRDRVFVNEGRVLNNRPASSVVWQKVTSMNGDTGWINGSYIAPER